MATLRTWLEKFVQTVKAGIGEQARVSLLPLIRAFERENLVLVLGAGVSRPYNIPTWNELLQGLLLTSLPKDTSNWQFTDPVTVAKLFAAVFQPTPLIAARYLRLTFAQDGSSESFEQKVREVLYATAASAPDSATMKEIRQLCVAPSKSPNLDSIITYNFDDVLERCLSGLEIEIPYTSIHTVGQVAERGSIPIYHVHGFLPRAGSLQPDHRITLSEDVYHEQYSDIYSWSNMVQINKFREKTCLFIGTSFSDPNLRRLLDIAHRQRGKEGIHHYLIKLRYAAAAVRDSLLALPKELKAQALQQLARGAAGVGTPDGEAASLPMPESDSSTPFKAEAATMAGSLIQLMERFEERDAASFGVGIIWITRHDQIAPLLRAIRKRDPSALRRQDDASESAGA